MLLDAETLDLAPHAAEVDRARSAATRASSSRCQRRSWRSSRRRTPTVADAAARARRGAARAGARRRRRFRVAGAGAHPFASGVGPAQPRRALRGDRRRVRGRRAPPARRSACTCTSRSGGADRALAVYNALRSYLPELAALAANAPFYEGRDSGLASVRLADLAGCCRARACRRRSRAGRRTRSALGRRLRGPAAVVVGAAPAPDVRDRRGARARYTVDGRRHGGGRHRRAGAGAGLAARHDAGEPLPVADSWRIDQNRWAALPPRDRAAR